MPPRGKTTEYRYAPRRQFVGLAGSLATVLGLGLVGCGGGAGKGSAAGSAAAKDVKGAAESKKLVVGFDKSYPPYGFVGDDGENTGFDLDLAKVIFARDFNFKYLIFLPLSTTTHGFLLSEPLHPIEEIVYLVYIILIVYSCFL